MEIIYVMLLIFSCIGRCNMQEPPQNDIKISIDFEKQEKDYNINTSKNEDVKKGCEGTETLNLDEMRLRIIKDNFIRSNAIQFISLQNNFLENIPYNILNYVPYLICLNLSRNKINLYNDNPIKHSHLQVLDLSYQNVLPLINPSLELFDGETEDIYHYTMFNNNGMDFPSLKYLDLSGNDIPSLSLDFDVSFPQLTHLYLININAVTLKPQFFNKIPKSLRVLHLENNYFYNLTLENVAEIQELYLDGNPLRRIDISSTKLKILSLSNCTKLTHGYFDIPYLEQLDLSKNNFYSMFNVHFEIFQSLRILLLDHNKFSEIPLLIKLQYLIELSLNYNMIKYIKPNNFAYLESLEKLSLKGNNIENIDKNTFTGLKKLRYLNLSENKLKNLHYNWISPLTNLQFLNANSNQFASISDLAIMSTSVLEHLAIKNNTFKEITMMELETFPNAITIYLA